MQWLLCKISTDKLHDNHNVIILHTVLRAQNTKDGTLTVVLRMISLMSAVAWATDSLLPLTCAVCSLGPVHEVLNVITALKHLELLAD